MVEPPSRPSSRERLLNATVDLLRTKGPTASGTQEILVCADAPRGSFYFHFPDGKNQLVAEALERAAAATAQAMGDALNDRSTALPERIEAFVLGIADDLVANDYRFGCAIGATVLEASATSPSLRRATETAFASWTTALTRHLVEEGIAAGQAAVLADSVVAGMEGATMMARARHDTAPLQNVATMLRITVAAALDTAGETRQEERGKHD